MFHRLILATTLMEEIIPILQMRRLSLEKIGEFPQFSQLFSQEEGGACVQTLMSFIPGLAGFVILPDRPQEDATSQLCLQVTSSHNWLSVHLQQGLHCPQGGNNWFLGRDRNFILIIRHRYTYGTKTEIPSIPVLLKFHGEG